MSDRITNLLHCIMYSKATAMYSAIITSVESWRTGKCWWLVFVCTYNTPQIYKYNIIIINKLCKLQMKVEVLYPWNTFVFGCASQLQMIIGLAVFYSDCKLLILFYLIYDWEMREGLHSIGWLTFLWSLIHNSLKGYLFMTSLTQRIHHSYP